MIREATKQDFDDILRLSADFWLHTQFSEPFNAEHTKNMVQLAHDHCLLAVVEIDSRVVGFCAGICAPLMGSPHAVAGTELAWWVDPEHRGGKNGIALLLFMEQLAKKAGVKYWNMVSMESSMPEQVGRMYEKMGYHKSETSYTKVI
jgi:GNAT superfamily N-acetyltransferase